MKNRQLTIGIQLTKNIAKYDYLLQILRSHLKSDKGINFIHIPTNEDLIREISNLDILTTYYLRETEFSYATKKLK